MAGVRRMRNVPMGALAVVAALASMSTHALAENGLSKPSPRQGHVLGLELSGVGATANDAGRGRRGPAPGYGLRLRLGESVTSWLDLGLSLSYARTVGTHPWSFGGVSLRAQAYLTDHLVLHGTFGVGAAGGDDPEDSEFSRARYGDLYTAGVGYGFVLGDAKGSGGWIVTPMLSAEYGRDEDFPNAALWVGIEVSYWFGYARHQLELDFDEAYK